MSEYVRIGQKADLPPAGEAREFDVQGKKLCIANIGGEISAMENECPHRQGPLGQGQIENGKVVCPWHAWAFDVKTGVASHNPNAKVEVYPVKLDGDDVFVEV